MGIESRSCLLHLLNLSVGHICLEVDMEFTAPDIPVEDEPYVFMDAPIPVHEIIREEKDEDVYKPHKSYLNLAKKKRWQG